MKKLLALLLSLLLIMGALAACQPTGPQVAGDAVDTGAATMAASSSDDGQMTALGSVTAPDTGTTVNPDRTDPDLKGTSITVTHPTEPVTHPTAGTTTQTTKPSSLGTTTSAAVTTTAPPVHEVLDPPLVSGLTPLSPQAYYGYQYLGTLGSRFQQAYLAVASAMDQCWPTVQMWIYNLNLDQAELVYECCFDDHPQFFYMQSYFRYWDDGDGRITALQLDYIAGGDGAPDTSLIGQQRVTMKQAAAAVLGAMPSGSDYDKELWLHDWLVNHVAYDHSLNKPYTHTLYGALVNGTCVCDGYAHAMQYLLYQAGVQCLMAYGSANGGGHAWNVVRINGNYYQLDVTWDDFDVDGFMSRAYFNVTTADIQRDHTFYPAGQYDLYPLPACTATTDNYYIKNNWTVTALDNTQIAAVIVNEINAGQVNNFYFRLLGTPPTEIDYEVYLAWQLDSLLALVNAAVPSAFPSQAFHYSSFVSGDELYIGRIG